MASIEDLEERIKKIENLLNLFLQEIDGQIETKMKVQERQIIRTLNLENLESRVDSEIKSAVSNLLPQIEDKIEIGIWSAINKDLKTFKSIMAEHYREKETLQKHEDKRPVSSISDTHGLEEAILEGKISLLEGIESIERKIILEALKKTNNIQSHAAEILGISRRILKYKMDKLGIEG